MADLTEKDLNRLAKLFAKELAWLMPKPKRGAPQQQPNNSNNPSDGKNKPKDAVIDVDIANKSIAQLAKTLSTYQKDMEDYHKGISTSGRTYGELSKAQSSLLSTMIQHDRVTSGAQDKLKDQIKDSISSQSALGKSLAEGATSMRELVERLGESSDALEDYERTVSDGTKSNIRNLKSQKAMKAAFDEIAKTTLATDTKLGRMGGNFEEFSKLSKSSQKAAFAEIADKVKANHDIIKTSQSVTQSFMGLYVWSDRLRMVTGEVSKAFSGQVGWMGQMASAAGAIALVVGGIKGMYGDFRKLSGVGLANSFMESSMGAIRMGVSMDEFTKMMKTNQNQLAQLSLTGFIDNVTKNQDKLIALGEGTDSAARGIAAMTNSAVQSGIDIRNDTALQDSIDKQVRSFTVLRALTGQTSEEFAKTNQQIMGTADFTKKMAVLDKTKRKQLLDGINKERERLSLMGLSNEQQVSYLNTINKMLGATVVDRMGDTRTSLMQTAGMAGESSAVIQKLDNILLKGDNASAPEMKFMAEKLEKYAAILAQQQKDAYAISTGLGNSIENQQNVVVKGIKSLMDNAVLANVSQDTKGVTGTELDARIAQATLDGSAVTMVKSISQLESALKNPMVATAAGVAALVVLATIQLKRNSTSLKLFGEKGKITSSPKEKGKLFGGLRNSIKSLGAKMDDRASKYAFTGGSKGAIKQTLGRGAALGGMAIKDPLAKLSKGITGAIAMPIKNLKSAYDDAAGDGGVKYAKKGMHFGKIQYNDENGKTRFQSDGSSLRQRKNENESNFKARRQGHQERYESLKKTIHRPEKERKSSGRKAVTKKIFKAPIKMMGGLFSSVGRAAGAIGSMGAKAIPFIGWAIAGYQAIKGGLDGAAKANEIFGLEATKTATSSQKLSAGIAGALSALTFGLVDINSTALTLDSWLKSENGNIADRLQTTISDSVSSFGMWLGEAAEMIPNAISDGMSWLVSSIISGIGTAVAVVWDLLFDGGSEETKKFSGMVSSFMGGVADVFINSFKFIGDSIISMVSKAINSLYEGVYSWFSDEKPDKLINTKEVKYGNRTSMFSDDYEKENEAIAKERKIKKAAIKARAKGYAEEDKIRAKKATVEKKAVTQGKSRQTEAERLRKARLSAIKNIGIVNGINSKLSEEQLAAQGVDALSIERAHLKKILGDSYKETGEDAKPSSTDIQQATKPVVNKEGLTVVKPIEPTQEKSRATQTISTAEGTFAVLLKMIDGFVHGLFGNTVASIAANSVETKIDNVVKAEAGLPTRKVDTEQQFGISREGQKFEVTAEEWKKIQKVETKRSSQFDSDKPMEPVFVPKRVQALLDQRAKDGTSNSFMNASSKGEDFFKYATPVADKTATVNKPIIANEIDGAKGVLSPSGLMKAEEDRKAQVEKSRIASEKAKANQPKFNEKDSPTKSSDARSLNKAMNNDATIALLQRIADNSDTSLVLKEKQIQEYSVESLRNGSFGGESQKEFFNKESSFA